MTAMDHALGLRFRKKKRAASPEVQTICMQALPVEISLDSILLARACRRKDPDKSQESNTEEGSAGVAEP
jgi:hypothetical protein